VVQTSHHLIIAVAAFVGWYFIVGQTFRSP
jgi:hypothetical protein